MPVVDVHTHMYPPSLIELLRSRTAIPYIRTFDASIGERLIILPTEEASTSTSRGRPIGPAYYDLAEKLAFMTQHGIDISVISLANPWLDWAPAEEAVVLAKGINGEMEGMCEREEAKGKLWFFATLPLSASTDAVVTEVKSLKTSAKHCVGVVMGTGGFGDGLDDPRLDSLWSVLEQEERILFLHPHYGLPDEVYGPRAGDYGHVLPLALGFPLETTIAVARMLLAGVFDRFPKLKVLLAHSGGTLPFLAGRIESCIAHDAHLKKKAKGQRRDIWEVLKTNIYLDAVVYSQAGLKAAIEASGRDRLMFGTDHPFFPPLEDEEDGQWLSVSSNVKAVRDAMGEDKAAVDDILGGNAVKVLGLHPSK